MPVNILTGKLVALIKKSPKIYNIICTINRDLFASKQIKYINIQSETKKNKN